MILFETTPSLISLTTLVCGPKSPDALRNWLYDETKTKLRRSRETKVALGPGGSFVAWDGISIRWQNVPGEARAAPTAVVG